MGFLTNSQDIRFFETRLPTPAKRGPRIFLDLQRKNLIRSRYGKRFNVLLILSSSVVERSAVNRLVVGSNPTSGAILLHSAIVPLR